MVLMRELVLLSLKFNIQFKVVHVKGSMKQLADAISRLQWDRFKQLAPWADCHTCQVHIQFWNLLKGMYIF